MFELDMHCDNCDVIDYCNGYEDTPPCAQPRFRDLAVKDFMAVIDYLGTRSHWDAEKMTNGDKIRAMNDKELAEFIYDVRAKSVCYFCNTYKKNKECDGKCITGYTESLKSEAE